MNQIIQSIAWTEYYLRWELGLSPSQPLGLESRNAPRGRGRGGDGERFVTPARAAAKETRARDVL